MHGTEANVIVCLWNRPTRIHDVLRLLDEQDFAGGVRLFLWNNSRADHQIYLDALAAYRGHPDGALRRVDIVKTPHNLGSIARFYWARKIARAQPHAPVIVIDDDQDFGPAFVSTSIGAYRAGAISAWWAWSVGNAYWDRHPAAEGETVDHIGPGGSVMNSDLFLDKSFFTDIPDQFRLLDDVWLSYFAKRAGYVLRKLPVEIDFVMEETNQHHGQTDLKAQFFDYLYGPAAAEYR